MIPLNLPAKIFQKVSIFRKKMKGFKIILVTCHTEQKFFRYCIFFGKNKNNCGEDFEEEGEEYVMEREKLQ